MLSNCVSRYILFWSLDHKHPPVSFMEFLFLFLYIYFFQCVVSQHCSLSNPELIRLSESAIDPRLAAYSFGFSLSTLSWITVLKTISSDYIITSLCTLVLLNDRLDRRIPHGSAQSCIFVLFSITYDFVLKDQTAQKIIPALPFNFQRADVAQ